MTAGAVAAGVSYWYLGRDDAIRLFGSNIRVPEWAIDGVLVMGSSALGKSLAVYAIPPLLNTVGSSPNLTSFVAMAVPPALTGAVHAVVKPFIVERSDRMEEFLLATGSQLAGDQVVKMMGWAP